MNSGKHPWLAGVLAGMLFLLLPITGAWGATPVSNLILRGQEGFTELLVPGAARLLCDHSSQEPSDKHPFRIVLDFCDAEHALGQQSFDALPATVISRIRTSQYTQYPQKVVRVVLDLRKSATYTVNAQQNDLLIRVVDPNRASFAVWEANHGSATLATASAATVPSKPVTPAATTEKSAVSTTPTQSLATSTPPAKTVATSTPPAKTVAAPKTAPSTTVVATPSRPAGPATVEIPKPAAKTEPVVATTQPATTKPVPVQPPVKPAKSFATEEPATAPTEYAGTTSTKPTTEPKPASTSYDNQAPSDPYTFNQTEPSKPLTATTTEPTVPTGTIDQTPSTSGYVVPKIPLVLAPEYLFGDAEEPAPATTIESEKVPVSQVSMKPIGPKSPSETGGTTTASTEDESSPALASTTTLPLATKKGTVRSGDTLVSNSQETLFERLRTKFFSEQTPPRPYQSIELPATGAVIGDSTAAATYGPPTPPTMLSREELLARVREAAASAGLSGGNVSGGGNLVTSTSLAMRENVIYDDMGRRDPFAPLVKGLHSGFVSNELPSVENLRLVGVLRDDRESLALFENQEGYGYVLRLGDKVENGTVAAIEENRVLFRVQDFGWTHLVALQLTSRGSDPTKSLGAKSPAQLEYQNQSEDQDMKPSPNTNQTPKTEGVNP
ncbi:MAG: AMIN domain-containing protein [candidate division Zixibacteria bacterium]|nr:AMIN domain-containing protein [candidate division Zixibacteria bacterium]